MSTFRPIIALSIITLLSLLCATLQVHAQFNAMGPPSSWSWSFAESPGNGSYNYYDSNSPSSWSWSFGEFTGDSSYNYYDSNSPSSWSWSFGEFTGDGSYNYDETNLYNPTNIVGLPNPAAVYCEENGGTIQMRDTAEGQTGYCVFPDGSSCDEWDFYNGLCGPQSQETKNSKQFIISLLDRNSMNLPGAEVFIDGVLVGKTDNNGKVIATVTFDAHVAGAKAYCGEVNKIYNFNKNIDGITIYIDTCPGQSGPIDEIEDYIYSIIQGEIVRILEYDGHRYVFEVRVNKVISNPGNIINQGQYLTIIVPEGGYKLNHLHVGKCVEAKGKLDTELYCGDADIREISCDTDKEYTIDEGLQPVEFGCDERSCRAQSHAIGVPYKVFGVPYIKYNLCECLGEIESFCNCRIVETQEIKFKGTVIDISNQISGAKYYSIHLDELIEGPSWSGVLNVCTINIFAEFPDWGAEDIDINEKDIVEVYGRCVVSFQDVQSVTINGREEYYLRKISESNCNGAVSGHVYDAETKKPIASATIFTSDGKITTQTDADGYYYISRVCSPTTLIFNCMANNYESDAKYVTINDAGLIENIDFYLRIIPEKPENSISEDIQFWGTVIYIPHGDRKGMEGYLVDVVMPVISGPEPCYSRIFVETYDPPIERTTSLKPGYIDSSIKPNDVVEVLGLYEEYPSEYSQDITNCMVRLYGSENYYIKKYYANDYYIKLNQTPDDMRPTSITGPAIDVKLDPIEGSDPLRVKTAIKNNKAVFYEISIRYPNGTYYGRSSLSNSIDMSEILNSKFLKPNTFGLFNTLEMDVVFHNPNNMDMEIEVSRDTQPARFVNTLDVFFFAALGKHLPLDEKVIWLIASDQTSNVWACAGTQLVADFNIEGAIGAIKCFAEYFSDIDHAAEFAQFLTNSGMVDEVNILQISDFAENVKNGMYIEKLVEALAILFDTYEAPISDYVDVWAYPARPGSV